MNSIERFQALTIPHESHLTCNTNNTCSSTNILWGLFKLYKSMQKFVMNKNIKIQLCWILLLENCKSEYQF